MSQNLPANKFDWTENTPQFSEDFNKKTITNKLMKDIFINLIFNILKNYMNFIRIYHFYLRERRLKNL